MIKIIPFLILYLLNSQAIATESIKDHLLKGVASKEFKPIKNLTNKDLIVLVAYGNECPVLRKYTPELNKMFEKYHEKVDFLLINAVSGASEKDIFKEASNFQLKIPLYFDGQDSLLKNLGFSTFSQVALVKLSRNEILYKGAINNQFTLDLTREKATQNFLTDAIESALKKRKVKIKTSKAYGCEITF